MSCRMSVNNCRVYELRPKQVACLTYKKPLGLAITLHYHKAILRSPTPILTDQPSSPHPTNDVFQIRLTSSNNNPHHHLCATPLLIRYCHLSFTSSRTFSASKIIHLMETLQHFKSELFCWLRKISNLLRYHRQHRCLITQGPKSQIRIHKN